MCLLEIDEKQLICEEEPSLGLVALYVSSQYFLTQLMMGFLN